MWCDNNNPMNTLNGLNPKSCVLSGKCTYTNTPLVYRRHTFQWRHHAINIEGVRGCAGQNQSRDAVLREQWGTHTWCSLLPPCDWFQPSLFLPLFVLRLDAPHIYGTLLKDHLLGYAMTGQGPEWWRSEQTIKRACWDQIRADKHRPWLPIPTGMFINEREHSTIFFLSRTARTSNITEKSLLCAWMYCSVCTI